jgi:hypothetical protein
MKPSETRRVAAGLCRDCGKPRAPNGSPTRCQPCAQKHALLKRQASARRRAGIRNPTGRPKKTKTPKPASQRAALCKLRRRQGLYPTTSILTEEHLDSLVKLEFLPASQRTSKHAIADAVSRYLDRKLVQDFEHTAWARSMREQRLATRSQRPAKPQNKPSQPAHTSPENPPPRTP